MPDYALSRCVAIQAVDSANAEKFYSELFGAPIREPDLEFRGEQTRLFLEAGDLVGPILEMSVADLDIARTDLLEKGCTVVKWGGKGQANYVRDPFGILWNIWQD